MSIRTTPLIINEYYHIYNRGVNKMEIFIDYKDYDRFLKLIYSINSKEFKKFSDIETRPGKAWTYDKGESLVEIGAYCLMPNHFHIIIREKMESGITIFMHRLLTSYSLYFNKKYKHSGSVFQGKFKSEHIDNDVYFKYLFSYIHLNPIKLINKNWKEEGVSDIKNTTEYISNYKYSSYQDFTGKERTESKILEKTNFPNYFPTPELFNKEIFEWIKYNNKK